MLPAEHRLRRRDDFAIALRHGRRSGRGAVVIHLHRPGSTDAPDVPARVGLVVSRAVGGAVVRNRVKRRLREIMRAQLAAVPAGSTVVLRALPPAAHASAAELAAQVEAGLRRLLPETPVTART
ncbi:MAG: ribonuclease P protein component [Sporichthyaceae bacterium]